MPLEPTPANEAPELFFGLIAPIGVDLDMVAGVLDSMLHEMHYRSYVLRLTKLMREVEVPKDHFSSTLPEGSHVRSYQERIAYANAICAKIGDHALAALAVSAIRTFRAQQRAGLTDDSSSSGQSTHVEEAPIPKQAYIIRQLKRPEEVALLREVYGRQFILVSAYAPLEWRIRRIERLEKISCGGLLPETEMQSRTRSLITQDAKESQDEHGQNVRDAFPLGDVFIDATSRINCEEQLRRFIHLLFGSNEISPTHDEYGAYLAKSASLRSSDLSRQVGAAIFRTSGEILTLGCNEVPRAGGGTYWTGDTGDSRDIVEGSDPNEARKTQVLVDLIDRLQKGGHLSASLSSIAEPTAITKALLAQQGQDTVTESKIMDLIEFGRIVHAEMSALSDAARKGVAVEGATLYCTTFPCHLCAKLIVASGIKKVIYLEPYPKSYAADLHDDSIAVDSDSPGQKVHFKAFLGVSPFRYRDLFEKRKRKDKFGTAQRWNQGVKRPMINVLYPSYFQAEAYAVSLLKDAVPT